MKTTLVVAFLASTILPAPAIITLNTFFGIATDADSNNVPDGTLWALVVDHNTDSTFAGFGLDDSLYAESQITAGIADTFFTSGQSISLGGIVGGGTVFAMGGFNNGDGSVSSSLAGLTLGVNGLAQGRNFAFYWFPDATFTGDQNDAQTIAGEVGGIQNSTADVIPSGSAFLDTGMIIPSDGNTFAVGAANINGGGTIANTSFQAVTLVPEPSSALLGAFGALALLRRRRVVQG